MVLLRVTVFVYVAMLTCIGILKDGIAIISQWIFAGRSGGSMHRTGVQHSSSDDRIRIFSCGKCGPAHVLFVRTVSDFFCNVLKPDIRRSVVAGETVLMVRGVDKVCPDLLRSVTHASGKPPILVKFSEAEDLVLSTIRMIRLLCRRACMEASAEASDLALRYFRRRQFARGYETLGFGFPSGGYRKNETMARNVPLELLPELLYVSVIAIESDRMHECVARLARTLDIPLTLRNLREHIFELQGLVRSRPWIVRLAETFVVEPARHSLFLSAIPEKYSEDSIRSIPDAPRSPLQKIVHP